MCVNVVELCILKHTMPGSAFAHSSISVNINDPPNVGQMPLLINEEQND
jgi:hypothetical protein